MRTYTAYKINNDGSLSDRENCDTIDHVNTWLIEVAAAKGFTRVQIICDQTGKMNVMFRVADDIWIKEQ